MSTPFGERGLRLASYERAALLVDDLEAARRAIGEVDEHGPAELTLGVPVSTAAFSRRDLLVPGYAEACAAVEALGFAPKVRPVGGRLAVYDEGSLVLHLVSTHEDARVHIRERFELLGHTLADALRRLGADARVGRVPGEYCEGEFSVNDAGRTKLVGTGQRITRRGYLFSAVVMVHGADRAREALTAAYPLMGLELDPETVGCVADSVPGVTLEDVRAEVLAALWALVD
ncbi:MAG: lipoate--protein ligase family protein [Nocardioidaceae bacterium]